MKNVTVKINKRNLIGLINKTSFNYGGTFVSYGFIAMDFDTEKNNTATFYESVQASLNSWSNYPGKKIWHNNNRAKVKKAEVLAEIEEMLDYHVAEMQQMYLNVKFELINF